jgi:hypothetical protein
MKGFYGDIEAVNETLAEVWMESFLLLMSLKERRRRL